MGDIFEEPSLIVIQQLSVDDHDYRRLHDQLPPSSEFPDGISVRPSGPTATDQGSRHTISVSFASMLAGVSSEFLTECLAGPSGSVLFKVQWTFPTHPYPVFTTSHVVVQDGPDLSFYTGLRWAVRQLQFMHRKRDLSAAPVRHPSPAQVRHPSPARVRPLDRAEMPWRLRSESASRTERILDNVDLADFNLDDTASLGDSLELGAMRAADIERQSTRGPANNQQTAHGNTKETGRFRRFRISLSILANSVMCSTAILIVVCRRMQDVSEAYRIAIKFSYSCWLISFLLVFFGLVHKQNTRAQRRLYVSSTVLLGIHMYGATLRNGDFYDGLVQFGPMILSASAYIAAAMFEARFGIVGVLQE